MKQGPLGTTIRHGLAAVLGLSFVGAATTAWAQDNELVKRGEYLVTMGDCVACHTAPGGEKFAGGLYMPTPFGKLSTPNITPDKDTGIGNYTDAQFYTALHEGINAKNQYLYPVFPFPWFTKVNKEDVSAIKAYLFSLKPVHAPRKTIQIGFPFNIRAGLVTWRTAFFSAGSFVPSKTATAEVNRGAYLVEGLGHCGECHNASKITGASSWSGTLEGGQIAGWYAPSLSDAKSGLGKWSKQDIATYLKTGMEPGGKSVALGPMHEVVMDSTSKFKDEDLNAIAAYLKSRGGGEDDTAANASKGMPVQRVAADAYLSHCASCHQRDGKGVDGAIPQLAGNGAVTAAGPQNIIRVVLGGLLARDKLAPMPALGQTMTDQEVADAVNYVRSSWGNHASADVGPGAVGDLRKDSLTMLAMNRPGACFPVQDAAKDPTLAKAIGNSDISDKLKAMSRADMLTTIDEILPGLRKSAPEATPDKVANGLTAAYCPIAMGLPNQEKSVAMGNFAVLTYGQAMKKDIKLDSGDTSAAPAPKPTP